MVTKAPFVPWPRNFLVNSDDHLTRQARDECEENSHKNGGFRRCSDDMDECASGPCRNGALCADSTSSDAAVPAPANTSVKTAETSAIRVS